MLFVPGNLTIIGIILLPQGSRSSGQMSIIIRTGFEKVEHSIFFQSQTESKGKKLVDAGHVCYVQELRDDGASFVIEATVIKQCKVTEPPYKTKLNIDEKRRVTKALCTCAFNKSGKCKHIAALIYYINNVDSLTKTDVDQQWGKPSVRQLTKEKYSKGSYFYEMFPPPDRPIFPDKSYDVDISELENPSPLKFVLIETLKGESDQEVIEKLMSSMLDEVVININKEECGFFVTACSKLCGLKQAYMTVHKMSEELWNFYKSVIVLSEDEIIQLCSDTLQQAGCDKWYEARLSRISASKDVHSVKSRKTKTVESLVNEMLNPVHVETTATRYGKKNESVAREQYQSIFHCSVKTVGVLVSKNQPWLCASLDGYGIENNNISKIVEFKCPYSCKVKPVVDYENKICNVNYLQFNGDLVQLKKSAIYYTQCQIQMYISGVDICDLFIYSPVEYGSLCVIVLRDETFLKEVVTKCEHFYFQHYLPALHIKKTKKQATCLFSGKDISNIIY